MLGLAPSISGRRGRCWRLLVRSFSGLRFALPENDAFTYSAIVTSERGRDEQART
jgi:hypothetical protein